MNGLSRVSRTLSNQGDNCSFDGLTSSAGVHRTIENLLLSRMCQQCEEKRHGNWNRRSNLKISQKQRSRLKGVELDKAVSSIYSIRPEAPDVQSDVASEKQTLKFKESLHIDVGSICSSGTFCPLIPPSPNTFLFS